MVKVVWKEIVIWVGKPVVFWRKIVYRVSWNGTPFVKKKVKEGKSILVWLTILWIF